MQFTEIIEFWFQEIPTQSWWQKDAEFDRLLKHRFGRHHQAACQCELYSWRDEPLGRLAEIIILDQFSRNIHRDSAQAFTQDAQALALAQEAVAINADKALTPTEKAFLYMPYMHSESRMIHQLAVTLFDQPGLENNLAFEYKHKVIIDRFDRYPHRNAVLGRSSSPEELSFLQQADSSF